MKSSHLLEVLVIVGFLLIGCAAEEGTCGPNLTWKSSNDETGVYVQLIINGTGNMTDFCDGVVPWNIDNFKTRLYRVIIKEGVSSVGSCAFKDFSGLNIVSIPSTVSSIGKNAFSGCYSLINLTIPDGVKSIGEGAFKKIGLESMTVPSSVEEIGTFAECSSLKNVDMYANVSEVSSYAFEGCSSLESVILPPTSHTFVHMLLATVLV